MSDEPRKGVRCPRCNNGAWHLGKTPAKMPRCWCRKGYGGCGHSWAPDGWGWRKGPGFPPISIDKINSLERLLAAGYKNKALLMAAAGISKNTLTKYKRRWQAKQTLSPQ